MCAYARAVCFDAFYHLCHLYMILLPGVRGRLVDLCRPVEDKYEECLGVVLARHLGSIVVERESVARDCVKVATCRARNQYGRTRHIVCLQPWPCKSCIMPAVLRVYLHVCFVLCST